MISLESLLMPALEKELIALAPEAGKALLLELSKFGGEFEVYVKKLLDEHIAKHNLEPKNG